VYIETAITSNKTYSEEASTQYPVDNLHWLTMIMLDAFYISGHSDHTLCQRPGRSFARCKLPLRERYVPGVLVYHAQWRMWPWRRSLACDGKRATIYRVYLNVIALSPRSLSSSGVYPLCSFLSICPALFALIRL